MHYSDTYVQVYIHMYIHMIYQQKLFFDYSRLPVNGDDFSLVENWISDRAGKFGIPQ